MTSSPDAKLEAPACRRNTGPIIDALTPILGDGVSGDVLEIGSGSGQHAVAIAAAFPHLVWWPSDPNPAHIQSINAWRADSGLANVQPASAIDATRDWKLGEEDRPPAGNYRAVFSANVIHISPWAVAESLFAHAGKLLAPDGKLILYGPFSSGGEFTAPTNKAFDASLKDRDPAWGIRDIDDLTDLSARNGLTPPDIIPMPANNNLLLFGSKA